MIAFRSSLASAVFVLFLTVVAAGRAYAVVIDFEALAHAGTGQQALPGTGKFYSEKGFNFVSSAPTFNMATWGSASDNYLGSTALWNGDGTGITGITTLTRASGGAFDLDSIDIGELFIANGGAPSVTFNAVFAGGGTISASFSTDGFRSTGNLDSFQTFDFIGFNDIVSVSWLQVAPFIQFDNVTIDSAAAISEPGTLIPFAAGLIGLLGLARRQSVRRMR